MRNYPYANLHMYYHACMLHKYAVCTSFHTHSDTLEKNNYYYVILQLPAIKIKLSQCGACALASEPLFYSIQEINNANLKKILTPSLWVRTVEICAVNVNNNEILPLAAWTQVNASVLYEGRCTSWWSATLTIRQYAECWR